jgi:CTP-dependent riboflavin kinase
MGAKTSRVATYASVQMINERNNERDKVIRSYIRRIIEVSKRRQYMKRKVMKDGDKMMLTKCYHHFHKKCMKDYRGRICPMCRRKL